MSARAILFDLYDTLVRPDSAALTANRARLAEQLGIDPLLMAEQWRRTHDGRMRGSYGSLEADLAAVVRGCGAPVPSDEALSEMAVMEYASWGASVALFPDVPEAAARLRARGFRLAIVSNASREAASVVRALNLESSVDAVVVSCEIGALKPEPALLQAALDRLEVAAREALLVDDAPENVAAAIALGLRGVLIRRPELNRPNHPSTVPTIASLPELWLLLGEREPELALERVQPSSHPGP